MVEPEQLAIVLPDVVLGYIRVSNGKTFLESRPSMTSYTSRAICPKGKLDHHAGNFCSIP